MPGIPPGSTSPSGNKSLGINLQADASAKATGGSTRLRDLPFMDLYIRIDEAGRGMARYRTPARDYTNNWTRVLPGQYLNEILTIAKQLRDNIDNPDSDYQFDGMRFRLSYQHLANNQEWVILRRISPRVFTLEELSIAQNLSDFLRGLGRRDGLILISGPTGHGKTTTSFALFADYLKRFGGVGISVEDPVEYELDGPVGEYGYCYQVQVDKNEDWATPLKRALRWTPRYLLVGEVRSPAAAEQILRAATTGHLVITTIHAGSVEESFMGLMHLADRSLGGGANMMLAQGITAAWHQTLTTKGPYLRYVFTEEHNNGDPVRALIRDNKVGMINTYIDQQIARMSQLRGVDPIGGKRR
ncbi:MAG: ATPase, T2SS/T4P/T4SS family [Bdellovibrionales bacterium]